MSGTLHNLRDSLAATTASWLERLQELVLIESPTENARQVNCAMDLAVRWAVTLDARVIRHMQPGHGDVVELWFGDDLPGDP